MKTISDTRPNEARRRKMDGEQVAGRWQAGRSAGFVAVYAGLFLLYTLSGATPAQKHDMSDVVLPITALIALIWSLWDLPQRIRKLREGGVKRNREGWSAALLSLSLASYGFGSTTWGIYELVLRQSPFPSWADAGYLGSFVFLISGILTMPTRKMPSLARLRVMVDGFVVTAALVTFSWFFILGPTILNGDGTALAKFLGALYPLADLAMICCLVKLTMGSREPASVRIRNYLTIGVLAYTVSDVIFGYLTLQDKYNSGNPCDVGWLLANFMIAQAALTLRKQQDRPAAADLEEMEVPSEPTLWRMLLPYSFVPAVVALMTYIWHKHVSGPLALGVYISAGILLSLILLRQVLAIAENSRLYKFLQEAYRELEALATTDGMTGLPNHRLFQERLRGEIRTCQANMAPVTLLLIDVDRFKQYNDAYGHPAGDEALRIVGRILKDSVRANDLPARYGGEEFAAILPNTGGAQAFVVAERIRAACEATEFPNRQVTLSIGVSTIYEGDAPELIERADQALYAAKHGGRNRVEIHSGGSMSLTLQAISGQYPKDWSLQASREYGIDRLDGTSVEGPAGPLLNVLLSMLSLRDQETERHADRVMRYCLRLAEQAAARGAISITSAEMSDLHLGALLHDIGKVGVPDAILHKTSALDEAEWEIVRRHPIQGAELLADMPQLMGAVPVVRSHHERWDGTGYPDGLAGKSIPLGARLFALADTLDAMWSDRPYRAAMDYPAIREEIRRMAGIQFDPALVEAFLSVPRSEWERIRGEAQEDGFDELPMAA